MKSLFTSLYSSILDTTFNSWTVPEGGLTEGLSGLFKGWDQSFQKLLKDIERMSDRRRGGIDFQKSSELEKRATQRQVEEEQLVDDQQPSALSTATDAETIARNIAALKARKKHKKPSTSRATSRSGTDTDTTSASKLQAPNKKTARKWDNGRITATDIAEYDFSEKGDHLGDSKTISSNFIDKTSMGTRNQKGLYEVADFDRSKAEEDKSQSTLFSKIMSSIPIFGGQKSGPIILREEDVKSMIEQIQLQLMKKNVAREIAVRICERIQVELIGQKLSDRSTNSLKKLINHSLEISLTKILTPKTSVDILADIHQKQVRQKQMNLSQLSGGSSVTTPYVMTFVGVNGVGKSTNLSKVAFWLLQNRLRVLIAACDTFRSGAVEQLRTHVRNLGKLDGAIENQSSGTKQEERKMIELFEKGYGKDAAGIAKEAIQYAKNDGFDVVLIDTAGRMQDNEPLMRALGKLVVVNQPDKILFVGEALVGNEAVDQLGKFDKSLKAFSGLDSHLPRGIDGIILTKFDTIDDKVGAALSMTYTINQPILFVGTGQTYTDLKNLKVNHVVNALMR
ncbi:hypothetical protein, variant [Puccinia striiformis f. sp. tritici PST-78]|nr:hypothetical protein, variant [Puccinia striiformis f. sp. tritici PST-78]